MASSLWLLHVVPAGAQWDVLQPRTGRRLDIAPTQPLAVERALERLSTGGAVEVVVDGFMVGRHVVLPPPVPRRTALIDAAVSLAVGGLMAILLGPLLDGSALTTVLGALGAANVARLVRQILAVRRRDASRPDPASTALPSQEASSVRA